MRVIAATVASFVVMFGLSGLFNRFIVRDFVATNVSAQVLRDPPDLLLVGAGYALLAVFMALAFPIAVGDATAEPTVGLAFGVVAGLVWILPSSLVLHGVYRFPAAALLIDPAFAVVEQGLGGLAIALVYRYMP